jgi:hypothetical protein
VVDYLLLHLKEEALPAQFDPRGRNFDVVVPTVGRTGGRAGGRAGGRKGPFGDKAGWKGPSLLVTR